MKTMDRVRAGAAFLDKTYGRKWRKKINLKTLNLRDGEKCILGQTGGNYMSHACKLGLNSTEARASLGFTIGLVTGLSFYRLTHAWKQYLREGGMT